MACPTFQIYRIGKRGTNLFFSNNGRFDRRYYGRCYWTQEGAFFRRMETIRKHLRYLV